MTEEKLIAAAHHMAEARERLIKEIQTILDVFDGYGERLRTFEVFLDMREALLTSRIQLAQNVKGALDSLVDVLRENTVTLNENTDRLNEFMTKMDGYFGSGAGLEHEN
jgi:hypothetical protein